MTPEPLIDIFNDDVPNVDISSRYKSSSRNRRGIPKRYMIRSLSLSDLGIPLIEEMMEIYL